MRNNHDRYGKEVLRRAFGTSYNPSHVKCTVTYGNGGKATIDGVLADKTAVEIESRASKQIRGAILDLLMNPLKKKVIILLPVHMSNIQTTANQCEHLLSKCVSSKYFRVIILKGHGANKKYAEDIKTVKRCLNTFI